MAYMSAIRWTDAAARSLRARSLDLFLRQLRTAGCCGIGWQPRLYRHFQVVGYAPVVRERRGMLMSALTVRYAVLGSAEMSCWDRGCQLGTMDGELMRAFSDCSPLTEFFWGAPKFEPVRADGEALVRSAVIRTWLHEMPA